MVNVSKHVIIYGEYLEFGTAVDLVCHLLVCFGELLYEFGSQHIAFLELWI